MQQAVEVEQQRGLAGAVGAEDSHLLPGAEPEAHAAQRLPAVRIGEPQVPHLQRRLGDHISTLADTATDANRASAKDVAATAYPVTGDASRSRIVPSYPRASMAM